MSFPASMVMTVEPPYAFVVEELMEPFSAMPASEM